MAIRYNSIWVLRSIINTVENSVVRERLEGWIKENVIEVGMSTVLNSSQLVEVGDVLNYRRYHANQSAHSIGQKVLENCSAEITDTAYGQVTEYKCFIIKPLTQRSDSWLT